MQLHGALSIFIFFSGNQPFIFLHAVERNKRKKDGNSFHILLVFGIFPIILVLTDLQAARPERTTPVQNNISPR